MTVMRIHLLEAMESLEVLEMKAPHGTDLSSLRPLVPVFPSYVLSFVYLGIYRTCHHHMLHVTERGSGIVLWANLHLLFRLSLIPFVSRWMGENRFAPAPGAIYVLVALLRLVPDPRIERVLSEGEK